MNNHRFELLLALILFLGGAPACSSSTSTPEAITDHVKAAESTTQHINSVESITRNIRTAAPTTQNIGPTGSATQDETRISVWDLPGLPPTPTVVPLRSIISEHDADLAEALSADKAPTELEILKSLWIGSLPLLPPDSSNAVADNPQAATLGQKIFFDTRFSANHEISCATCHKPELMFTDGLPQAEGIGKTVRNSMTIIGTVYNTWFFWDGRRDSQWAQALAPLEDLDEHGGTRTQFVHLIDEDPAYRTEYEAIFDSLPDFSDHSRFPEIAGPLGDPVAAAAWAGMSPEDRETVNQVFSNLGKAIAAYERLIIPGPSRFDAYVQAALDGNEAGMQASLTLDEVAGMRLFINSNCIYCHNGPLFTGHNFFNVGVPNVEDLPLDIGRFQGLQTVLTHEFNCLSQYSDAGLDECAKLTAIETGGVELRGAFKVPSLRNVAETAPYMSSGQYASLRQVLEHYNRAEPGLFNHTELLPLNFSVQELSQLEAFLRSLSGDLAVDSDLLGPLSN